MKTYDELTITDDFLFCKVMSNPDLCQEMIEILLDIKIDHISFIEQQHSIAPEYTKHSIRLDVYVKDSDRIFDIEMQTTDKYDLEQRTRYYQGLMDIDQLQHEMDYKKLKETYIIFICNFDPFYSNYSKYVVTQCLNNNKKLKYDDNTHKVFYNLNGKPDRSMDYDSSIRLSQFLQYLRTKEPTNDFTYKVEQAAQEAKYNTSWRKEYMTVNLWIEEAKEQAQKEGREAGLAEGREVGLAEGREVGLAEGQKQKAIDASKKLIKAGIDLETIARCEGLSIEEVEQLSRVVNFDY